MTQSSLHMFRSNLAQLVQDFFGFDVFISYRRDDAEKYAIALHRILKKAGLSPYLDQEETPAAVQLTDSIASALKKSRVLVIILTPGVLASDWVRLEFELFQERRHPRIIPISAGGFLRNSVTAKAPFDTLTKWPWFPESAASLDSGIPAPNIVREIRRPFRVRTARRSGWATVAAVFLALLGSVAAYVGAKHNADQQQAIVASQGRELTGSHKVIEQARTEIVDGEVQKRALRLVARGDTASGADTKLLLYAESVMGSIRNGSQPPGEARWALRREIFAAGGVRLLPGDLDLETFATAPDERTIFAIGSHSKVQELLTIDLESLPRLAIRRNVIGLPTPQFPENNRLDRILVGPKKDHILFRKDSSSIWMVKPTVAGRALPPIRFDTFSNVEMDGEDRWLLALGNKDARLFRLDDEQPGVSKISLLSELADFPQTAESFSVRAYPMNRRGQYLLFGSWGLYPVKPTPPEDPHRSHASQRDYESELEAYKEDLERYEQAMADRELHPLPGDAAYEHKIIILSLSTSRPTIVQQWTSRTKESFYFADLSPDECWLLMDVGPKRWLKSLGCPGTPVEEFELRGQPIPSQSHRGSFTPDSKWLLTADPTGLLMWKLDRLGNPPGPFTVLRSSGLAIDNVVWSRDSNTVAAWTKTGGKVMIWNASFGRSEHNPDRTFLASEKPGVILFSPSGRWLMRGTTLYDLSASSRTAPVSFDGLTGSPQKFVGGERWLLTSDLRLWPLDESEWLRAAALMVKRNFRPDEWTAQVGPEPYQSTFRDGWFR